ncbi:MAG: ABC transporter substrate-binding protein [Salinibacterium sp.]|nr:ABC transporter substrate-binding protein [Salinibacterium sp.]
MVHVRARASIVGALVVCTLLGACTSTSSPEPSPTRSGPTAAGDGILRIGTLFPSTGTIAFIGPAQAAGVALAVADLNAAGGVNGVPVEVLARDSADAAGSTLEASFAELVAGGADVVIGPSTSVLSERIIPRAAAARIPVISPAATFPALGSAQDAGLFFRTVASYDQQGLALGSVLAEDGPKKVAFLYIDDELGRSLAATIAEGVQRNGGELVLGRAVDAAATDLTPVVAELAAAAADLVVIGSNYSSIDSTKGLISAAISAGFSGATLWLTTQNTGDFSQAFPNGTLAGVRGIIDGVEPDATFVARLQTVDPALTTFRYSTEAYDATILAALAAIVAGDDSGLSIAARLVDVSRGGIKCTSISECLTALKTLSDIDYDGVSGPVNFTPDGDVSPAKYGIYSYDGENRFVFERAVVAG